MKQIRFYFSKLLILITSCIGFLCFQPSIGIAQQINDSGSLLNEAYQYYQKGAYHNTIAILEDALAGDSMQVRAYQLLASAQLKLDSTEHAAHTVRRGLHYFPGQSNLLWLKAEADFLSGNAEQAREQYVQLDRKYDDSETDHYLFNKKLLHQRLFQVTLVLFNHAAAAEKWDKARSLLHQAAIYQPDSSDVSRNLLLTYIKQEKWSDAVTAADSVLKRFPNENELLRLKAIALYHEKKYADLLSIYRKLYHSDPSNLEYALPYAELLAANNEMTAADSLYKVLLKKYPKRREIYRSLLSMSKQNHSPIGEVRVLQRMREHFPDDPAVMEKMAEAYARMDSSQTERIYYDSLLAMTHDTVTYRMKTVQSYQRVGKDTTAYLILTSLSKQYPDQTEIWETKGRIEEKWEDWHRALHSYNTLKGLHDDAETEKQLGIIFEKLEQPDSAMVHYHRSMNRATRDPYVPYRLAILKASSDSAAAFDLARFALQTAFRRLQEEQSKFQAQMRKKQTISGLVQTSQQADILKHIDTVAREDFSFLTQHFPEDKVGPLLDDMLNTYRGSGRLYTMAAKYYLAHDNEKKAFNLLQQSARWSPDLVDTQWLLGNYYEKQNQVKKAIQAYSKVITLDEENSEAYKKMINLYQEKHELDQLCDQWLLQFRTHRKNHVLQQHLIEALDKAGRYKEAREVSRMNK